MKIWLDIIKRNIDRNKKDADKLKYFVRLEINILNT